MRTLNYVVLVLVLASFGFVSFGCGDSDSPTAPSSTTMAEAPSVRATAPSTPVRGATPASFDVAPGDARYGPNAYDFFARMDSGMLHVALVEDAMQTMRNASQPHRMRQVDVYHVTSEPRQDHVGRVHGDPLYSGTVQLAGRLELPPIEIAGCAPHEWIVVTAAELSDDRYDGWRNAPCPLPNGVVVGSDGTGPGWDRSEYGAPSRDFPTEPEPMPEPDNTPMPEPDNTPMPKPDPTHVATVFCMQHPSSPFCHNVHRQYYDDTFYYELVYDGYDGYLGERGALNYSRLLPNPERYRVIFSRTDSGPTGSPLPPTQ